MYRNYPYCRYSEPRKVTFSPGIFQEWGSSDTATAKAFICYTQNPLFVEIVNSPTGSAFGLTNPGKGSFQIPANTTGFLVPISKNCSIRYGGLDNSVSATFIFLS